MGKVVYPYAPFSLPPTHPLPPNPPIDRPVLSARLQSAEGAYCNILALADSGADACVFSLRMARSLKLNLALLPRSTTSGLGSAGNVTYYATITVDIGNGLRFETNAGFTQGMDNLAIGLLGQQGFFENYNVEFRHRDRIFSVESA